MKNIFKKIKKILLVRNKGYSLSFAVFVFATIIILSSTLLLAAQYNNLFFSRIALVERLNSNAASAINLMLAHPDMLNYGEIKFMSLYNENADSVKVEKDQWGVFDLFTVTAFHKKLLVKRSVMTGNYKYDSTHVALLVPDQGKPISVSGKVEIKGNTMLPESGLKNAHIEGKTFTGSYNGNTKKSNSSLPKLNENLHLTVDFFRNKYLTETTKVIDFNEFNNDTLSVSFLDSVIVLYSPYSISLDYLSLQGKIIVLSEKEIRVPATSNISDIICVAPYISVNSNFTGKLQMFANDSIRMQEKCVFKYPSVTGICNVNSSQKSLIYIGEKTVLNGMAFLYQQTISFDKPPLLHIAKDAIVKGQVYSNGNTELKGSIYGALYTSKFILSTPSAVYENTLMDTDIDMYKLSRNYVGADLVNEETTGGVIKWVY